MAVVINEFEVVVEKPQQQQEQPVAMPQPAQLAPRDVADIVRHQAERLARLWAH